MLKEIRLGDVRIENGALTYSNAQDGSSERLTAINMTLRLPDLQSRLEADGALDYKGQTVSLRLSADQPAALLQGGASPVALSVETTPAKVGFEGQVDNGAAPAASGRLDLDVSSIRDLAAWLAEPLAFEGEGLRTLKIASQLDASPQRVALTDTTIGLDAIEAKGELVADLSGAVPKVDGRLDLGAVDLDPYLPPPSEDAAGSDEQPGEAGTEGWSDEPIAVPPIGGAEVDFALSLDSLTMREIEVGRTVLGLKLAGSTLSAALQEMALYGGKATGNLEVAVADGVPAIRQQFQLDGLNALPFLTAVAGFERLEGNGERAARRLEPRRQPAAARARPERQRQRHLHRRRGRRHQHRGDGAQRRHRLPGSELPASSARPISPSCPAPSRSRTASSPTTTCACRRRCCGSTAAAGSICRPARSPT